MAGIASTTTETSLREQRRGRTRAGILAAARDLIVEKGADAVSLREIARRAQYSPAALYKYFASKEELIGAVGTEALQVLGSYLEAVQKELPPANRAVELGVAYVRFAEEHKQHFTLVFSKVTVPVEEWAYFVQVAWPFTVVVEAVRAGIAAGVFMPRPGFGADGMAFGLWSLAHGMAMLRQTHLGMVKDDFGAIERAAFEAYVRGLSAGIGAKESKESRPSKKLAAGSIVRKEST